jgi:hypothetical protein
MEIPKDSHLNIKQSEVDRRSLRSKTSTMKPTTLRIQIAEPCHENWNKMLEEEKGKFCLSCQKTVVDFSRMTNEQIINYFEQNAGKSTCGRIAKHQHDTPISNYRKVVTPWFNKYVAGFFMALGFYHPSKGQTVTLQQEHHMMKGQIAIKNPSMPVDKKLVINGRVLDSKTNKGIRGVEITVAGSEIVATSDKNGNYSIEIPSRLQNESLYLIVNHTNYMYQEITGIDHTKTTVSVVTKLYKEDKHEMIMGKMMPIKEQ